MSTQLTSLICPHCGATVQFDQATLTAAFRSKDARTFVYVGSDPQGLQCEHCKTNFAPASELQRMIPSGATVVIDTGGAALIGGKVTVKGGSIIGRDKVVVINRGE